MATKPTLGAYVWASDVNYTTGPAPLIGTPTKVTPPIGDSDEGWKADQKPPAQWENFSVNYLTQWASDWVRLGSNIAGADAHIVETDASGIARVVDVFAGGNSQAESGLGIYGDGSDGNVTIGAGITTLTRDMYYASLTLDNVASVLDADGFRIFVSGTLLISDAGAVIRNNGLGDNVAVHQQAGFAGANTGTTGGGSAGGAGGANQTNGTAGSALADAEGGTGGTGGDSNDIPATTGGAGGVATPLPAADGDIRHLPACLGIAWGASGASLWSGGTGGGGGAGGADGLGGGGGGGGGVLVVCAKVFNSIGTVQANGGDGAQAGPLPDAAGNGGGAGGGGGVLVLVTRQIVALGTVEAAGGAGGNGVALGDPGAVGGAGLVLQLSN